MPEKNAALENAGQIEALADKLSECANEIHLRIMKAIRKRPTPGQPGRNELDQGIDHTTAQSLFESELV